MANEEQLSILKQGVEVWNDWRRRNPAVDIDLKNANLSGRLLGTANLSEADLLNANLSETILIEADLRGSNLRGANLNGAQLNNANLSRTNLRMAQLERANLWGTKLLDAKLNEANLQGADLIFANLLRADLRKADLTGATLNGAILVNANINQAKISKSTVYGISVWDLIGEFAEQQDLVITPKEQTTITVDDIKVAQFIYLILDNEEIRDVINTFTSKSVLILGRFGPPERKVVLDELRNKLREYNLLPIVFDFERPDDKDYTETVQTLAGLSLFVIVDVTNPKSTPLEMEATVKQFKIPYVPIIDLTADKNPFAMMVDLQKNFHWVLQTVGYHSKEELLENIDKAIISRALEKHNELSKQKAKEPEILTIDDLRSGKDKK